MEFTKVDLSLIETAADLRIEFHESLGGKKPEPDAADLKKGLVDYFSKAIPSGQCVVVLAKCDGLFVGMGAIAFRQRPGYSGNANGNEAYVLSMYTKEPYRKRGIASGILTRLEQEAIEGGAQLLELHATEFGEPLYAKSGYWKHSEPTYRKWLKKDEY